MPDLTVIDGGGEPHDYDADIAQQAFEEMVIELLRSLARDDHQSFRIVRSLLKFIEHARSARKPPGLIVEEAVSFLHTAAFPKAEPPNFETTLSDVVKDALRVAAESMAQDPAARGRRSQRDSDLLRTIKSYEDDREERARALRMSFLASSAKSPPKKPRKAKLKARSQPKSNSVGPDGEV